MPRDIGPDMLANLDRQRDAGDITIAQYDARRVEVLELIRKGKAIEWSIPEKVFLVVMSVVLLVSGVALALMARNTLGLLIGLSIIVAAFLTGRRLR